MKFTFRPAETRDAAAIKLRPEDAREAAMWAPGVSAVVALAETINTSLVAVTAWEGTTPVAIFGLSRGDGALHPWLMCAAALHRRPLQVSKVTSRFIRSWMALDRGTLLCNYVARDNAPAQAFLKHLGFVIVPAPGRPEFDFFFHPESCA